MKKNLGNMDRGLRLLFAVTIAVLYFTNQLSGAVAITLGLFAVIFVATAVIGFCPLYLPLKLSSKKTDA